MGRSRAEFEGQKLLAWFIPAFYREVWQLKSHTFQPEIPLYFEGCFKCDCPGNRDIYLTPPPTRCTAWGHVRGLSEDLAGVGTALQYRGCLRGAMVRPGRDRLHEVS